MINLSVILKTAKGNREAVKRYLLKQKRISQLYKIDNGYNFLLEASFKGLDDVEEFIDNMTEKFKIDELKIFYIIDCYKQKTGGI
mgnify:CR=1 FL=1